MKIATLAIIVRYNKILQRKEVLLGEKKTGEIGIGTLNGPGGKCESGESILECVVRETQEEVGILLDSERIDEIACITFFAGNVADFKVHIFYTEYFSGTPVETSSMIPAWYGCDALPFERMLESDREWFARAVRKECFQANVYYADRAKAFERIEFIT